MNEGMQADNPPTLHSSSDGAEKRIEGERPPADAGEASFSGMENLGEIKDFQQRLHEIESKVGLVDIMYGLHKSTTAAMTLGHHDDLLSRVSRPGVSRYDRYHGEVKFLADSMFFMQRIRDSYQVILDMEKEREVTLNLRRAERENAIGSISARKISINIFLKGERARLSQADWNDFIFDADFESSILYPIEVVTGEPEPRTILQLSRKGRKARQVERSMRVLDDDEETTRNRTLPERIKIYSAPLILILSEMTDDGFWKAYLGGSIVVLRPYQDLFYYEAPLRRWLARLEKDFEGYEDSASLQEISADSGGNDQDADGSGAPTCESLVGPLTPLVSTAAGQHKALETELPERININREQTPHEIQDEASDREVDDFKNTDDAKNTDNDKRTDDGSDGELDSFSGREKDLSNSIMALVHLRTLMEFFDNEIRPRQEYVDSPNCSHVTFHDLWHLFKPGTEVIEQGGKQAFVVLRVEVPVHKIEEPWGQWSTRLDDDSKERSTKHRSHFTLHCAFIDFDGKNFGPVSKAFIIPPFGDLKSVMSLPIYPVRFKGQETQQSLIRRGRLLLEVANYKAMYYTGPTLDKGDEIDSQVVIDFSEALADEKRSAAWEPTISPVNTAPEDPRDSHCNAMCCRYHGTCDGYSTDLKMTTDYIGSLVPDARARSLILSPRSLEETLASADDLTETELLIMTYRVFGFVLRSRKWGLLTMPMLPAQLDLGLLRYENSSARSLTIDAFERLELPEGHRELVQSLVTQHFRNRQSSFTKDAQTDLIQGKGKGLIMLLHGAPGVGKTTTAEGIAELFRRPLFQITCGDLGTTAKEVEEDLERSFALASRWGCILLLDEADVFLAARSKNDFARNGLVAVFLRVLEYYAGILFLTTNRIGDLDEAFASRIQMSLHYPELDELKTLKVFRLHLDLIEKRFKEQGRTITYDISSIEDFASQHYSDQPYNRWNGRQIRNACHTALALAEFDAQKNGSEINLEIDKSAPVSLQLKYFKIVQKAYLDFGVYLADIQGTEGDDRAFQQRLRARKNTPFEKQSLFDSRSGPGQPRRPHHTGSKLSDMSPTFNVKAEPFHDDQHRHQRQYSSATSSQTQGYGNAAPYNQMAGGSFRDYGTAPAHIQQMHGQQTQMDARFPMERQQTPLYESPQAGLQPTHSGEAHLHPSLNLDGSPLPHRPPQPQPVQYGYSSELQADTMRSTAPRVQPDPAHVTHSGYTYTDGAQGGPSRSPQRGGNMPQM